MKKVFTLALVMAMAITSFAQVKSISRKSVKMEPAQQVTFTGLEDLNANFPASTRNMMTNPEISELAYTVYDWQSNMGPRNFTAVWPDGYAVMCNTLATNTTYTDRGTGLAWYDPAVGEWDSKPTRAEDIKTGFGSIARYKENGLVIAAHTASDCRIFIVEDFRSNPTQSFGEGIVLPIETGVDPCWPVVQCSGENLDIINVLCTNSGATTPCTDPIIFYQYVNGAWTHQYEIIPNLDGNNMTDGGSNITYFMQYDPERPNRIAFILNNAWSDGKAVISENNGETWTERIFYKHTGINLDFGEEWFFYPRWTGAAFDGNDNLHIVYEYNGSTGAAGSGSYYPAIGGIGYWSEILPKNAMCLGGIGAVGQPFIMDTTYLQQDLYLSEWYWSDALHEPLPEYIGELEIVDENDGHVLPRDSQTGLWINNETWGDHGKYNGGKAEFASMHYDKGSDRIFAVWSQIAGDEVTYYDSDNQQHYLRLFCNVSFDGGQTWEGTQQVVTDFANMYDEMVYGQVIPYTYTDAEGDYIWYCYQLDGNTGTYVQSDDVIPDDNLYAAVKIYVDYMDVEENGIKVADMMNVYPNPAQGSFKVQLNNEADVTIYNTVGQLVKSYNNVKEVNVNLESGVYFVNANNQTMKVVVK